MVSLRLNFWAAVSFLHWGQYPQQTIAKAIQYDSMPPFHVYDLDHVALHVADVAASVHFYGEVLGFDAIPRPNFDFPGAWFRLGERQELHRIGGRAAPSQGKSRGNHYALRVEAVTEVVTALRRRALEPLRGPKQRPDGIWQVFYSDLDGHVVEFWSA